MILFITLAPWNVSGYEEDYFLQSLNVTFEELEPLADDCTQVRFDKNFYDGKLPA
jgi:hypothetical protein